MLVWRAQRAKRVAARLMLHVTPRKIYKMCCELLYFAALPLVFRRQRQVPKGAKKSASKPCQMPTSSLCAALLLDERVQNFSDLDDRDASR